MSEPGVSDFIAVLRKGTLTMTTALFEGTSPKYREQLSGRRA